MPFKINYYPSKQNPALVRKVYLPLKYYSAANYDDTSRYKYIRTLCAKHQVHPNKFIQQSHEYNNAKPYHETIYKRGIAKRDGDSYYVVQNTSEDRLDIISQRYYGSPIFWWVIAQANASVIFDPFNVPRGTKLRIPQISSLYRTGGILDVR